MENILIEALNNILLENRESKNINLARKYLKSEAFNDVDSQKILDYIRTEIPNIRLGQCKFLLGACRLYLHAELRGMGNSNNFNKLLPYIASEAHINEYDNNLNNLSLEDIIDRFSNVKQKESEQSRKNSYNKQYNINNDYKIVRIPDFKTASQYGNYTSWCITYDEEMYDTYTNKGIGLFYFCLKNGFENVPKEQGENCPLDEYGLSMIAVSVNEDGEPNTITCRWNHDMGGNDNVMTKDELEELLGVNFYEVFKPYTNEELISKGCIPYNMVQELLSHGVPLEKIFNKVGEFINGCALVELHRKYSFINVNSKMPTDKNGNVLWFNWADNFHNGIAIVENNNKFMFIDSRFNFVRDKKSGKILVFDYAEYDNDGKYMVNFDWYGDFWMDSNLNFYDYDTLEPIQLPYNNNTNENKKYIKKIIKETINKYLYNNLVK